MRFLTRTLLMAAWVPAACPVVNTETFCVQVPPKVSAAVCFWKWCEYLLVINHRFSDSLLIGSTTYYQPALDDAGDYRLLEQAGLIFTINDHLDFTVKINLAHDSAPPAAVHKTDIDYTTGLELSF